MRFASVASGIDATSVAWKPLGFNPVFFAEITEAPSLVLKFRHPEIPNHGDFTKIKSSCESIDILVGGTPCQSFSLAGLRGGMDDERGNLALEFLRLADRLRPRWLVWENVPGVLSSNGGRDFGAFLGGLVEIGYGFAYRVLDAQYFGCAISRARVFVVAYLGDWRRGAATLFDRSCLSVDCERASDESAIRALGVDPSSGVARTIAFTDRKREGGRQSEWRIELAYTPLVRRQGGSRTARQIVTPDLELRCLTPRETERLMGFPDDYTLVPHGDRMLSQTHRFECLGNSMAIPPMRWLGQRIKMIDAILDGLTLSNLT